MEQSASPEHKISSADQEMSHILLNPKVHYHIHKRMPHDPLLSHINPVHHLPTYHINILILFPTSLGDSK